MRAVASPWRIVAYSAVGRVYMHPLRGGKVGKVKKKKKKKKRQEGSHVVKSEGEDLQRL